MKGMEAAIRGALERAGTHGAGQRAQIYRSARTALQRSLEKQGITDTAVIARQLDKLDDLIDEIEAGKAAEEGAAAHSELEQAKTVPPVAAPSPLPRDAASPQAGRPAARIPDPGPGAGSGNGPRTEPVFGQASQPAGGEPSVWDAPEAVRAPDRSDRSESTAAAPRTAAGVAPAREPKPERPALWKRLKAREPRPAPPKQKKRRPVFATLFSFAVLFSFFGIGLWFLIETGALKSPAERDTSVPNPPARVDEEDFAGTFNPGQGFSGEWTTIFVPGRESGLQLGPGVTAETVNAGPGPALRIESGDGGPAGEASIMLPPEALQSVAGGASVMALTMRAASSGTTQVYVECDFGTLGGCGRKRFDVTYEASDFLITLDFSQGLAPAQPGRLIINSDISGKGMAIELLAVRVRRAG